VATVRAMLRAIDAINGAHWMGTLSPMADDFTDPTTEPPEPDVDGPAGELPTEADPADVVEQSIEVPIDPEDDRPE
jgi:hypothetical protein